MNRENKKRQLRRQIVPPRYQTEEESEQAIRNAHKKTVRKRLAVLAVVAVLLGGAAFGIYYYDRTPKFDMKRIKSIFELIPSSHTNLK